MSAGITFGSATVPQFVPTVVSASNGLQLFGTDVQLGGNITSNKLFNYTTPNVFEWRIRGARTFVNEFGTGTALLSVSIRPLVGANLGAELFYTDQVAGGVGGARGLQVRNQVRNDVLFAPNAFMQDVISGWFTSCTIVSEQRFAAARLFAFHNYTDRLFEILSSDGTVAPNIWTSLRIMQNGWSTATNPANTFDRLQNFGDTYLFRLRTNTPGAAGFTPDPNYWKLGGVVAGAAALDPANYVQVEINGVLVRLAIVV